MLLLQRGSFDEEERDILVNGPGLTEMCVVATCGYAAVDTFVAGRVFSDDEPRSRVGLLADGDPRVLSVQRPAVDSVPLHFLPDDILKYSNYIYKINIIGDVV